MLYTFSEQRRGFNIVFTALPEDLPLKYTFDDTCCDLEEIRASIDLGDSVYFCARVEAYKNGILLGCDYLGACHYNSYQEFHETAADYYADMVDAAIAEAEKAIDSLKG